MGEFPLPAIKREHHISSPAFEFQSRLITLHCVICALIDKSILAPESEIIWRRPNCAPAREPSVSTVA